MVHLIIRNLPMDGVWPNFKQLLTQCAQDHLDRSANLDPPPPPNTLLNIVITHISIECNCLESSRLETRRRLPASMPTHQQSAFVSTPTNIRKHAKNPLGVRCSNCHLTSHDHDHFFHEGVAWMVKALINSLVHLLFVTHRNYFTCHYFLVHCMLLFYFVFHYSSQGVFIILLFISSMLLLLLLLWSLSYGVFYPFVCYFMVFVSSCCAPR